MWTARGRRGGARGLLCYCVHMTPDNSDAVDAVPPETSPGEQSTAPIGGTPGSNNSLWGNLYFYSQCIVLIAVPVAVYGLMFDRADWYWNVRWWVLVGSLMAMCNWLHCLLGEPKGYLHRERTGEPVDRPYLAGISWAVGGASMGWVHHLMTDGGSQTQVFLWVWAALIGLLGVGSLLWEFLPWSDH